MKKLESILTYWKFKFIENSQFDDKFQLTDDTRKTILMKTLLRDYVKVMREQYEHTKLTRPSEASFSLK